MAGPLYRQIADQLRRMIESGELKAGMQIPTEDQLMNQFLASRNTVRGALRELTTRGLVYTLHGKGTFVSEPVAPIVITLTSDPKTGRGGGEGLVYTAEVAASGREPDMRDFGVGVRRARPAVARSLGIPRTPKSSSGSRTATWTDCGGHGRPRTTPGAWRPGPRDCSIPVICARGLSATSRRSASIRSGIRTRSSGGPRTRRIRPISTFLPTATCRWSRSGASRSTRTAALSGSPSRRTGPTGTGSSSTTATLRATTTPGVARYRSVRC